MVFSITSKNLLCNISTVPEPHYIAFSASGDKMFVTGENGVNVLGLPYSTTACAAEYKLLQNFGSKGEGDGQFCYIGPDGVCVRGEELLVVDTANHRLQVFDPVTGAFRRKYGSKGTGVGQFTFPCAMCMLPDGRIVVGDQNNSRVQVCTYISKIRLACDSSLS